MKKVLRTVAIASVFAMSASISVGSGTVAFANPAPGDSSNSIENISHKNLKSTMKVINVNSNRKTLPSNLGWSAGVQLDNISGSHYNGTLYLQNSINNSKWKNIDNITAAASSGAGFTYPVSDKDHNLKSGNIRYRVVFKPNDSRIPSTTSGIYTVNYNKEKTRVSSWTLDGKTKTFPALNSPILNVKLPADHAGREVRLQRYDSKKKKWVVCSRQIPYKNFKSYNI